jgi:Flp pilus assembly protein TadG
MKAMTRPSGFARDENGGAIAFSLFLLAAMLLIGGYAVDVSNVMTARTKLQIAADAAAHAALLTRETESESASIAAAVDVALRNMPEEAFGLVLHEADVQFGDYDADTGTFTPIVGARDAVRVETRQQAANGNAIATYLMKLVGFTEWNITTQSIFVTYHPTCLREGFVAEEVVDLQSNNLYTNGFCIHSNSYVSLNSNNFFEPGTVVSMPNEDDVELPNSGFETNIGLQEALHSGSWNIRIVSRINALIADLRVFGSRRMPAYITSAEEVWLPDRSVEQADLVPGRVHRFSCGGGAALTIKQDVVTDRMVLVTDCKVKFEQGVTLTNTVIATTENSAQSVTAAASLQVGLNDNCAPGGGAQIVTMGSMSFPSDLRIYGGQLLAVRDIEFSANANGIQGAALVAGGLISGTSNMEMGFCGTGMENNFHAEYFKLVY